MKQTRNAGTIAKAAAICIVLVMTFGVAMADPSPNGPGQPGAPGTTCGSPNACSTPGNSANANGSPFNPNGIAGQNYAGNPGTASLQHANSPHAISQYDIACFQVTQHMGTVCPDCDSLLAQAQNLMSAQMGDVAASSSPGTVAGVVKGTPVGTPVGNKATLTGGVSATT